MEATWGSYVDTASIYISVIQFYRDFFYAGIIVFNLIYKEEWLDSSWYTLKPLLNFL